MLSNRQLEEFIISLTGEGDFFLLYHYTKARLQLNKTFQYLKYRLHPFQILRLHVIVFVIASFRFIGGSVSCCCIREHLQVF